MMVYQHGKWVIIFEKEFHWCSWWKRNRERTESEFWPQESQQVILFLKECDWNFWLKRNREKTEFEFWPQESQYIKIDFPWVIKCGDIKTRANKTHKCLKRKLEQMIICFKLDDNHVTTIWPDLIACLTLFLAPPQHCAIAALPQGPYTAVANQRLALEWLPFVTWSEWVWRLVALQYQIFYLLIEGLYWFRRHEARLNAVFKQLMATTR